MALELKLEPWFSPADQQIEVGDRVVYITKGYGNLSVDIGTYAGTIKGHPVVNVVKQKWGYFNETGKNVGYYKASALEIKGSLREVQGRTILKRDRIYKLA